MNDTLVFNKVNYITNSGYEIYCCMLPQGNIKNGYPKFISFVIKDGEIKFYPEGYSRGQYSSIYKCKEYIENKLKDDND